MAVMENGLAQLKQTRHISFTADTELNHFYSQAYLDTVG